MKAMPSKCPAEFTLALLAGAKRFSELFRALTDVAQKVLTQQLREMERHGLVERKVFAQVPPKVVYSLTPLGRSLKPVVDAMCRWGVLHGSSATAREAQS